MDRYVFAVKGGISLGSYEAGLNWTYIEHLRSLRSQKKAKLDTFVGASAGSINTLLSALRYCQDDSFGSKENSMTLFRKTWDVGIQDFIEMPGSKANTNLTNSDILQNNQDSIFSLNGLSRSLNFINEQFRLSENNLRGNCQINIGIAVTKLIPDSTIIAGIEVINQRYIFPLTASTQNGKLIFRNLNADNAKFTRQDNYLYLPEINDEIAFKDVLRIVLASSAFPLTFPPVQITYCKKVLNSVTASPHCPQGYTKHKDQFIDGGNFDNAPIGAAMKIHDPNEEHKNAVFILINPSNKRNREIDANSSKKNPESTLVTPGIKEYLKLGYHIFDHGMSAELYQTARHIERLQRKSNSDRPSITITDRYFPVTGDYLLHFGAFFDKSFRQHDFWIGVYDGVINIAENICKITHVKNHKQFSQCIGTETWTLVKLLNLKKQHEFDFFKYLSQREFYSANASNSWQWLSNTAQPTETPTLIKIAHAIDENNCQKTLELENCMKPKPAHSFDEFLQNIKQQDSTLYDLEPYTKQIINNQRGWKYPILNAAVDKLYDMERKKYLSTEESNQDWIDQRNLFDILKMSTYVGKTYFAKKETGLWPNSTLGHSKWFASVFVPDEIGISYRQTSIYAKYKTEKLISRKILPIGFESRFIPINWTSRTRDANKFMGAEFIFKSHIANPLFSTLGVGYGYYNVEIYNRSYDEIMDSFASPMHGLILDFGAIASKIKISLIYRGSKINDDNRGYVNWAVNLGLNDIKGLRWLW